MDDLGLFQNMNRDANAAACQVLRQPSPLFKHYHCLLLCAATGGVYTYCSHVILRFECVFFQHCGFELGPRRQGWPIGTWSGFQQNSLVNAPKFAGFIEPLRFGCLRDVESIWPGCLDDRR